jgi:hypothetical protein
MSDDGILHIQHLPADLRALVTRLIATDEGIEKLRALAGIDVALSAERTANSDDTRDDARRTALRHRDELLCMTGVTALEKRRLYITAIGANEGAAAKADDFDKLLDRPAPAQARRIRLRMAHARLVLDSSRLFGDAGGAIVGQKLAHNAGKRGPLDPEPGEDFPPEIATALAAAEGEGGKREKLSGVDARRGDLDFVKLSISTRAGELAGELYGAGDDIDPAFWEVMARHFNRACREAGVPAQRGGGFYSVKNGQSLRSIINKSELLSDAFKKTRAAIASA